MKLKRRKRELVHKEFEQTNLISELLLNKIYYFLNYILIENLYSIT